MNHVFLSVLIELSKRKKKQRSLENFQAQIKGILCEVIAQKFV